MQRKMYVKKTRDSRMKWNLLKKNKQEVWTNSKKSIMLILSKSMF